MDIEQIEQWVGRDVVDSQGETVGKLEQVYFRGREAVLAEVKPGKLTRKRLLVPLTGASLSRDYVRVDFAAQNLLEEVNTGAGYDHEDLAAVTEHYGAAHTYESEELESASARAERFEAMAAARHRADELEAVAQRAGEDAEAARARADAAAEEAEAAAAAHRNARAEAEKARAAAQ